MDAKEKKTHFGNELIPEAEKKGRVKEVFDSVSDKYDLMNDLMSMGTHRLWKRIMIEKTGLRPGDRALDVAGGTADIAMLMADRVGELGKVVVYDINGDMLSIGREKCLDKGFIKNISYAQGDAELIPFGTNTFHAATVGFGIRNVTHIDRAFKEMARVVKPGGRVVCLEFSHPSGTLFNKLYDAFSFSIIPAIGEIIAKDRDSYVYLAESIRKFPPQEELKKIMEDAGLFKVKYTNLFNGIAAIHVGHKV